MDFFLFLLRFIVFTVIILGPIGVIYLVLKIRQTSHEIEEVINREYTLLRILVPKQNDKTPMAAEEMFASIHGIYRPDQSTQDHLSFELAARDQYIQFFAHVPKHLKDFVEGQIYAQYPTVEINEVQDYTDIDVNNWSVAAAELTLTKPDFYPIKTFNNFTVDPLAGITSVLSKIEEGEQVWVQILTRPVPDTWQAKTLDYVKAMQEGKDPLKPKPGLFDQFGKEVKGMAGGLARHAIGLGEAESKKEEKSGLPGPVAEALKGAETKTTKLGFEVVIRVCAIARDEGAAVAKINNLVGAFKQYNIANMNGFQVTKIATDKDKILPVFQSRAFPSTGYIFNVEELASIYHLPSTSVETPSIVWAGAKKGEPPANLPIEGIVPDDQVTLFAQTNYRHFNHRFGIKIPDRRYHMYAIGKTGTGKSTLLRNMIIDDIQKGRGVCVVDPHGDLIQHVLNFIPDHRVEDLVYFNPADREHPIGFNLLESVSPDLRSIVASGLMSIFTKLWANVWSARMEYILRNTILALLEYPDATMLEIMKILVDPVFRRKVLYHVKDPVIRSFFLEEYEKWDPKFRTEAIAALQNKVGQFLSSSTIRNIMGQKQSTINMREIMDEGKILLVDLSVGKIGEDNAALLGSMIITKIQLAAMGRADIPEDDRKDFYLYVDEFQNFATDSFAVILSEARKYHLNLIIAHQYIAQMSEVVASAVFGNVGTIVAFRVGAGDGDALAREFEPVFNANDLVNLDNYHVYLKMAIDARTALPFSAVTLPPFSGKNENRDRAILRSIEKYASIRAEVEEEISSRNEANSGKVGTLTEVDGEIIYKEELKPYEPMNPLPKNDTVEGKEYWKIRDKEGKPYYVAPADYDSYMWAKDKESDRPGAPAKPADAEGSADDSNDDNSASGNAGADKVGETPQLLNNRPSETISAQAVSPEPRSVLSPQPQRPIERRDPQINSAVGEQSDIVRHKNENKSQPKNHHKDRRLPHNNEPRRDNSQLRVRDGGELVVKNSGAPLPVVKSETPTMPVPAAPIESTPVVVPPGPNLPAAPLPRPVPPAIEPAPSLPPLPAAPMPMNRPRPTPPTTPPSDDNDVADDIIPLREL